MAFTVIQGDRFSYQSKAHMRFSISAQNRNFAADFSSCIVEIVQQTTNLATLSLF